MYTSRCVSLCASRLWICLAMELNASCKSAPSASTSSSQRSGSTTRGSWVTCSKDSLSARCDKINVRLGKPDTKQQNWGDKQTQAVCGACAYQAGSRVWPSLHYTECVCEGKCVQNCLTNGCETNDHVDRFEMSSGGRHMSNTQGVQASTQEEHLSPLWFMRLKNLALKELVAKHAVTVMRARCYATRCFRNAGNYSRGVFLKECDLAFRIYRTGKWRMTGERQEREKEGDVTEVEVERWKWGVEDPSRGGSKGHPEVLQRLPAE